MIGIVNLFLAALATEETDKLNACVLLCELQFEKHIIQLEDLVAVHSNHEELLDKLLAEMLQECFLGTTEELSQSILECKETLDLEEFKHLVPMRFEKLNTNPLFTQEEQESFQALLELYDRQFSEPSKYFFVWCMLVVGGLVFVVWHKKSNSKKQVSE